ncbi:SHOCT domain-containing protein [Nocardioides caricicola]|uniref:SHOCT domain-containing protein n=1 Tax=Nocardioides caricicola TaxID=634770 RepID=A0ABW0N4D4_9ACTN
MVVLVPRQVRMTGMTGNVPYYGGRFTPAQAYAASHPPPPPPAPARPSTASLNALADLLADGVITPAEYDDLRARLEP